MSADTKSSTIWVCKGIYPSEEGDADTVGFELHAGGKSYIVFVSGANGTTGDEFINAMRAAAMLLVVRLGGDPSEFDAGTRIVQPNEIHVSGKPN